MVGSIAAIGAGLAAIGAGIGIGQIGRVRRRDYKAGVS